MSNTKVEPEEFARRLRESQRQIDETIAIIPGAAEFLANDRMREGMAEIAQSCQQWARSIDETMAKNPELARAVQWVQNQPKGGWPSNLRIP